MRTASAESPPSTSLTSPPLDASSAKHSRSELEWDHAHTLRAWQVPCSANCFMRRANWKTATRMLEMSYGLGPEGGGVDYLAARYVGSAKAKAAQGDLGAAAERLDAGMNAAEHLRLPRLAAGINNERIRMGIGVAPSVAARLRSVRAIPRDDGIATITAELDEESAVRLLLASGSDEEQAQAGRRATELLAGIDARRRPLAALRAELLLAEICSRPGRSADQTIPAVARRCREIGLPRLLVDAGLG